MLKKFMEKKLLKRFFQKIFIIFDIIQIFNIIIFTIFFEKFHNKIISSLPLQYNCQNIIFKSKKISTKYKKMFN